MSGRLRFCRRSGCRQLVPFDRGYCERHDRRRDDRPSASARLYDRRWRKARESYLARNPFCVACEAEHRVTPATVVDHIKPHRFDASLFWNVDNWQPLCKLHHDRKTASGL